jgi:hypothetical protein
MGTEGDVEAFIFENDDEDVTELEWPPSFGEPKAGERDCNQSAAAAKQRQSERIEPPIASNDLKTHAGGTRVRGEGTKALLKED